MNATQEEWRPVVGWEGLYEVSSLGRVRSLDRDLPYRHTGRTYRKRGQVLKPTKGKPSGYYQVGLSRMTGDKGHSQKRVRVHILVLEAFVGPRPNGYEACHGPKGLEDNSVPNVRWDTKEANMQDSVRERTHKESRKTHCVYGHPFVEPNMYVSAKGLRICRLCARERQRRKQIRKAQ